MKQKDITLIVVVAIVSVVIAFVASNMLFGPSKRQVKAEVVDPISSDFQEPKKDDPYFNANAIDPTQTIRIGTSENQTPFKQPTD